MKISNKMRKQVLNAISNATFTVMNDKIPEWKQAAPEDWDESIKEQFDLISEIEYRVCKAVEMVLK